MASVSQVRALPGGRVLVHDLTGRRLLLFDSTFKNFTVIADTTSATANAYGSRLGGLISARDDTSLFVDPTSTALLRSVASDLLSSANVIAERTCSAVIHGLRASFESCLDSHD
jgi:hypothetical protein